MSIDTVHHSEAKRREDIRLSRSSVKLASGHAVTFGLGRMKVGEKGPLFADSSLAGFVQGTREADKSQFAVDPRSTTRMGPPPSTVFRVRKRGPFQSSDRRE